MGSTSGLVKDDAGFVRPVDVVGTVVDMIGSAWVAASDPLARVDIIAGAKAKEAPRTKRCANCGLLRGLNP